MKGRYLVRFLNRREGLLLTLFFSILLTLNNSKRTHKVEFVSQYTTY